MNDMYRRQVALLIRVMPLVFKIKDFAVHGGTAINLFHRNLPRYSVDIEDGNPDWSKCCAGDLSYYPSVRWKLQNIAKLKSSNPTKHKEGVDKLMGYLNFTRDEKK